MIKQFISSFICGISVAQKNKKKNFRKIGKLHILPQVPMKRSRARVPIGGQYVLLQISLRIKIFDFF